MNNFTKNLALNLNVKGAQKYLRKSKNIFVLADRIEKLRESGKWAENEHNEPDFFNNIDFSDLPTWGKAPIGTAGIFSWDIKERVFLNQEFALENIKDSFCEKNF